MKTISNTLCIPKSHEQLKFQNIPSLETSKRVKQRTPCNKWTSHISKHNSNHSKLLLVKHFYDSNQSTKTSVL